MERSEKRRKWVLGKVKQVVTLNGSHKVSHFGWQQQTSSIYEYDGVSFIRLMVMFLV